MFARIRTFGGWAVGAAGALLLAAPLFGQHCSSCDGFQKNCPGCQAFQRDCAPTPGGSHADAAGVAPDGTAELSGEAGGALPQVEPDGTADVPSLSSSANRPSATDLAGLSGGMGAAQGNNGVPTMIGDFFAGGFRYGAALNNANASPAGSDRRVKFSDNNSPFPQNRVVFNYNHFHNALVDINAQDQDVNRYTFGLERLFGDGLNSWEVRVPFAGTLSSDQFQNSADTTSTEFGNIAFALKRLLYQGPCFAVSSGLGIVLPTGDDSTVFDDGSIPAPIVTFNNDAVHLQPFIGVYAPRGRSFHQVFAQLDFDVNGNDVATSVGSQFGGQQGTLQDQTLLFLDYSYGYWLFQNRCHSFVQGLAPMVELHYSTTTQNQDYGPFVDTGLFTEDPRLDVLNLTGGFLVQFSPMSYMKVGGVAPLRTVGSDKAFDAEFGLQFTRRY